MPLRVPSALPQTHWPTQEAHCSQCKLKPCKYLLLTLADTLFPILCSGGLQSQNPLLHTHTHRTATHHVMTCICTCLCCQRVYRQPLNSPPPLFISISASSHCVCIVAGSLSPHSLPRSAQSSLYNVWIESGEERFMFFVRKKCFVLYKKLH